MIKILKSKITNEYIKGKDYSQIVINNSNKGIHTVLVSNEDFDKCKNYIWNVQMTRYKGNETLYVYARINKESVFLHRYIINVSQENVADHINGDTLDNRRENLRECTQAENNQNKSKNTYASSGTKGIVDVSKFKGKKNWMAYISVGGKHKTLGYFYELDEAIKVRKQAEKEYYKEFLREE